MPILSDIEVAPTRPPLIHGWTTTPIPNFSLSASGLLVLADLSTIAQRTVLRGGSSWLDSLLLVPGLHYQQAADELSRAEGAAQLTAVEMQPDGTPTTHRIVNRAVVSYVLRTAKEGKTVVLDVGELPVKTPSWTTPSSSRRRRWSGQGQRGMVYGGKDRTGQGLSWAAQSLYLASPVLTCVAISFVVLLQDYWALGFILALMLSRILNIAVIKARSQPNPADLPAPFDSNQPGNMHQQPPPPPPRMTQYTINLDPTTIVILRGLNTDLRALTTTVWLRPKTHLEGYFEAIAKMLVYLVACVSGNASQAGNLVLLVLLLTSAGLLALSNAQVTGLRSGGRVVAPSDMEQDDLGGSGGGSGHRDKGPGGFSHRPMSNHIMDEKHQQQQQKESNGTNGNGVHPNDQLSENSTPTPTERKSWPQSTSDVTSFSGIDDSLERGEAGRVSGGRMITRTFPSDDSLEYEIQLETRMGTVQVSTLRNR